jgi:predicted MFS family arabinose efflux permease
MLGGAAAGLLEPTLGWRGLMALCGGVSALAFWVVWRGATPEARTRLDLHQSLARYRSLLANPRATTLFRAVGVEGLLVFGGFPYFANHLFASGMGGTREAGLTVAGFGCGGFLYALLAPLLVRRLGPRRMMRLGGGLAGLALVLMGQAPLAGLFVAGGVLLGLGFFMLHNSMQTRVTEVAPQARASTVALHAFHFFLGQAAGPVVVGGLRGLIGLPATLALTGMGLVCLGLFMGAKRNTA